MTSLAVMQRGSRLAAKRLLGVTTRRTAARALTAWSGSLSFAGAESDFVCGAVRQEPAEWSQSLSFASPESDFTCGSLEKHESPEWSDSLSFASPEADFCDSSRNEAAEWSQSLSFASPEADYVSAEPLNPPTHEWSESLSFASPDADFCHQDVPRTHAREDYIHFVQEPECLRESLATTAYNLASPESDFGSLLIQQAADAQLKKSLNLQEHVPLLPTSLYEALGNYEDPRAIVVTKPTAPFEIVAVNDAWVGLCGYTQDEARSQSLGKLLQGPETQTDAVQHMMDELLHGKSTSTILTNYNKEGEKFHNRIQAGPIVDQDTQDVRYFVGVLQKVQEAPDHFGNKMSA